MVEDLDIRAALWGLAPAPDAAPRLDRVVRRARVIRGRRLAVSALVAALAITAIVVPLAGLSRLGRGAPPVSPPVSPTTPIVRSASALGFEPTDGWQVVTSNGPIAEDGTQSAWASTAPFADGDLQYIDASANDAIPFESVHALPADGILIDASIPLVSNNPLPADPGFPDRALLQVADAIPCDPCELQGAMGPNALLSDLSATVQGYRVLVRVFYGRPHPTPDQVHAAQAELDRLVLPALPVTTAALDEFGISMDVPTGWHGFLARWSVGEALLLESSGPMDPQEYSLRRGLGPTDVAIVLSESIALNPGYPPGQPPISVGPGDRCDACSVAGDGPDANPGHARFQTTFTVAGRAFELSVEFGSDQVTQAQLDQLNAALATLTISPASPGAR